MVGGWLARRRRILTWDVERCWFCSLLSAMAFNKIILLIDPLHLVNQFLTSLIAEFCDLIDDGNYSKSQKTHIYTISFAVEILNQVDISYEDFFMTEEY